MDGQPVWLASISRARPSGERLYVPEWSGSQRREAARVLRLAVAGVGDVSRERLFRMNITLCLHRAATDTEVAAQPKWFLSAPGYGLAGGPVEVLSETVKGSPSTRPCIAPRKRILDGANQHAWLPIDCGECEPCVSRHVLEAANRRE